LQALKAARQCIAVGHFDAAIKCLRDSGEIEMAHQLAASYTTYKSNNTAAAAAAEAIDSSTASTGNSTDTLAAVEVALAQAAMDVAPVTVDSSVQREAADRLILLG
jgi:fructoselysine-6-P-deglycase FrlB-like protein